jgi:protein ATS1
LFGSSESGNIRVLGSDKWDLVSKAPATVPQWKDVGASWGNIYVLSTNGELTAWGRDDHGQLPPPKLPPLSDIAIGSEHVVALSNNGEVMAWGWGEHGNCGPRVENNDVKGRWNVIASNKYIPPGCRITKIGAGCATSWISITSD